MIDTGDLETRRLAVYLTVAFGVAWGCGGVIVALGGLGSTPVVASLSGVELRVGGLLIPTVVMFAPTMGHLTARIATGEDWSELRVRPRLAAWRSYPIAWFGPPLLIVIGAALYVLVRPGQFDPGMAYYADQVEGATAGLSIPTLAAIDVVGALTIGTAINTIPAFGEEFGWRGYLFVKLRPLGDRVAAIGHGLIWGVWHWPIILMGDIYGHGYPGEPITGPVLFCGFTVGLGTGLAWLTVRSESVWPAAIAHGAVNASAVLGTIGLASAPDRLLGPMPTGLVGMLPWLVIAGWLLSERGPAWRAVALDSRHSSR